MKPVIVGALLLLFGVTVPAFAQEEHHEESAKPAAKQDEAKPAPKQDEAKPPKQEEAKPAKQKEAKPEPKQQQAGHTQQSQGQYAKNGQKDSRGHEYSTSKFGPDHHARFVATGGRYIMDGGSTPTAAIGSMQEHIRRGFTSRTCTSLWERMGYGMQLHTVTLL